MNSDEGLNVMDKFVRLFLVGGICALLVLFCQVRVFAQAPEQSKAFEQLKEMERALYTTWVDVETGKSINSDEVSRERAGEIFDNRGTDKATYIKFKSPEGYEMHSDGAICNPKKRLIGNIDAKGDIYDLSGVKVPMPGAEREIPPKREVEVVFHHQKELEEQYRTKIATIEADLQRAERILQMAKQGQRSKDPKIRSDNIEAERLAAAAIVNYERARRIFNSFLKITRKRYRGAREAIDRINNAEGFPVATVSNLLGNITVCRRAKGYDTVVTEEGPYNTFQPGDVIETNQGFVEIVQRDGTILQFGPNSKFKVPFPGGDSGWELFKGKLHLIKAKIKGFLMPTQIYTPTVIVAVRGTEFDLKVDENNLTHFVPHSGKAVLTARPERINRDKVNRWWERGKKTRLPKPLPEGRFLRVTFIKGKVQIKRIGESRWERFSHGDTLAVGETLKTGKNGFVQIELRGELVGAIGANAILEVSQKKATKQPLFGLWQGKLYIKDKLKKEMRKEKQPIFVTPNTVCIVQGTEFEVFVDENDVSHFTPYSGTLEIIAQMEKLDQTKINRWWDKLYEEGR